MATKKANSIKEKSPDLSVDVQYLKTQILELQKIATTQTEELERQAVKIRDLTHIPTQQENPPDRNKWFENANERPASVTSYQATQKKLTGSALSGNHYYRVNVPYPMSPELSPYRAECADIIEALQMTFNEGEAFKALWRGASTRLGNGKEGVTDVYNAEKAAHYGKRVEVQLKQQSQQDDAS